MDDENDRLKEAKDIMESAMQTIFEVFQQADKNNDGELTKDEFMQGLEMDSVQAQLAKADISIHDAAELFEIMDADGSGAVQVEEWIEGCLRCRGQARAKDLMQVQCDLHQHSVNMRGEFGTVQREILAHGARLGSVESLLQAALSELGSAEGGPDPTKGSWEDNYPK